MRAPRSTATRLLATPTPASSWVWMPTWACSPSSATTRETASPRARGQRGAVGVAQRDVLGARLDGRAQAAQRVVAVARPGVEEVLGVVDHPLALAAQERHGVGDHAQVLLGVHARDLLQVQRPGLAHQRAHRARSCRPGRAGPRRPPRPRRGGGSCRRRRSRRSRTARRPGSRTARSPSGSSWGTRPRSCARPASPARARRAPSRRRTATCPRPACRRGASCRIGGPARPWWELPFCCVLRNGRAGACG